jgi:hypothetical protein
MSLLPNGGRSAGSGLSMTPCALGIESSKRCEHPARVGVFLGPKHKAQQQRTQTRGAHLRWGIAIGSSQHH